MSKKYVGKAIYEKHMKSLREKHTLWKKSLKEWNTPFFMTYIDFKDAHLKDISGGALKLYMYLGFHVNNFTGECWHSTESIAEFFGNDTRTIKKWFKELEERGLVFRIQTGFKRIANTFLLPYGDGSKDFLIPFVNEGNKKEHDNKEVFNIPVI